MSVYARIFCGDEDAASERWMVIVEAINSSKLMLNTPIRSGGRKYRHANPSMLYPPNPCSHASDMTTNVGLVKVIILISTP